MARMESCKQQQHTQRQLLLCIGRMQQPCWTVCTAHGGWKRAANRLDMLLAVMQFHMVDQFLRGMPLLHFMMWMTFAKRKGEIVGSPPSGSLRWTWSVQLSVWADLVADVFSSEHDINNQRDVKSGTISHKCPLDEADGRAAARSLVEKSGHETTEDRLWMESLHRLGRPGTPTDSATYASLLRRCGNAKALVEGKLLHALITRSKHKHDRFLGNLLVQMYGKCGALEDARAVFNEIYQKNLFSWNILIGAYAQHGHTKEAFQLFQQMTLEGALPNKITFVSILDACGKQGALEEGKDIHSHIVANGLESDVIVGTALVNMYSKCCRIEDARMVFDKLPYRNVVSWTVMVAAYAKIGNLEDARMIFDKMPNPNVVSWTVLITAYAQHGHGKEAFETFKRMQLEGIMPNKVTFLSILNACASQESLAEGRQVHASIMDSGFELDVVVGTALVNMYNKCGSLENAWNMFNKLPQRSVVSWNVILGAYIQHGQDKVALQLFQEMLLEGVLPNKVTFVIILSACSSHAALAAGKWIHLRIIDNGFEPDVIVGTALVNMYGKCGHLEDARRMFEKMLERNVVSWNSMIAVYAQHGFRKEALQLFQLMQLENVTFDKFTFVSVLDACDSHTALAEGKLLHSCIIASDFELDVIVGTALVNMYCKCGSLVDAQRVFDKMPERNVVSWTVMITAYGQHLHGKEAFQAFQQMQLEGVVPDKCTVVSILAVCASQAALDEGKQVHGCIEGSELEGDDLVACALINMYGKCGSLEHAQNIFDKMPERDVVLWTAMIAAYGQHGHAQEALQLFDEMQLEDVMPNGISFVSVLSACSHAGLVDEACDCFVSMNQDYGIAPTMEHYNCMIDLFGRVGLLDEGQDLINSMPFQPTARSWMILLGACKAHFDVARGKYAAENVLELDPENAAPYILLSSIYATAGRWNDAPYVIKDEEAPQSFCML